MSFNNFEPNDRDDQTTRFLLDIILAFFTAWLVFAGICTTCRGAEEPMHARRVRYYACGMGLSQQECSQLRDAAYYINRCAGQPVLQFVHNGQADWTINGKHRRGWAAFQRFGMHGWGAQDVTTPHLFAMADRTPAEPAFVDWETYTVDLRASESAGFWPGQIQGILQNALMRTLGFETTNAAISIMNSDHVEQQLNNLTPWDCQRIHLLFLDVPK